MMMMGTTTQRQRNKLLKRLRKAIYSYDANTTQENADVIAQLTDYCAEKCGKKAVNKTVDIALRVLRQRRN